MAQAAADRPRCEGSARKVDISAAAPRTQTARLSFASYFHLRGARDALPFILLPRVTCARIYNASSGGALAETPVRRRCRFIGNQKIIALPCARVPRVLSPVAAALIRGVYLMPHASNCACHDNNNDNK